MPYIAFDLDAISSVPDVARSANTTEGAVAWGLLRLWQWCWRIKTDVVTPDHIRGFFGCDATAALEAFGFLEAIGDGTFRVKGAARYLRLQEARSRGGHAAKQHLIPGARQKSSAQRPAESQPRDTPETLSALRAQNALGFDSALTSTIEQPLKDLVASQQVGRPTGKRKTQPVRPGWQALIDALAEDYRAAIGSPWEFVGGRDATALSELRKGHSDEEIRSHWRKALRLTGFEQCTNLGQLRTKWGDVAKAGKPEDREEPKCRLISN